MRTLHLDIETFSPVDLKKCGVYRYAEEVEVMLLAYAWDDDPVEIVDLVQGEKLPADVNLALGDAGILKTAYNAQFERVCLSHYYGKRFLDPSDWHCVMAHGLYLGLPAGLGLVAQVLGQRQQKMGVGMSLINYFCKPDKNGVRHYPADSPERWKEFKAYCKQDVEAEREMHRLFSKHPIPEMERKLYVLDQQINDRGVRIDLDLVRQAVKCDEQDKERTLKRAVELTGLDNPKSVSQLKNWLLVEEGEDVESLNKKSIPAIVKRTDSERLKEVLELRQGLAKTSVQKYKAMLNCVCNDGRLRGLLQYYGANRTGRWAGRLVQVHNLPQNHLSCLESARDLLKGGEFDVLGAIWGSAQDVLSQLIRTAFVPKDGSQFIVTDFSAIEARVIAWLASEQWRLDVFKSHGYIYEASASAMFHVPWSEFQAYIDRKQKHPLRQKGKVSELALGYQGAAGALIQMGALDMGLTEEELPGLVRAWRDANPAIVQLWRDVEQSVKKAIELHCTVEVTKGVFYTWANNMLYAKLPSGRSLAYVRPAIEEMPNGRQQIVYEGMDQTTKKWVRQATYGGKLVENLVQAIARDCLAEALLRLDGQGYDTVMHVHDEDVLEVKNGFGSLDAVNKLVSQPISWAPGLPLNADGFEGTFYRKDG